MAACEITAEGAAEKPLGSHSLSQLEFAIFGGQKKRLLHLHDAFFVIKRAEKYVSPHDFQACRKFQAHKFLSLTEHEITFRHLLPCP